MTSTDTTPAIDQPTFDFEHYRQFIAQIQLRDIWLVSSKTSNKLGPDKTDERITVFVKDESSWVALDQGFRATTSYTVRFKIKNRLLASVDVTFAADFASPEPMTDELFAVFEQNNLPLNTWPYLREFLSSVVGRMGWIPFTLPARKINTGT